MGEDGGRGEGITEGEKKVSTYVAIEDRPPAVVSSRLIKAWVQGSSSWLVLWSSGIFAHVNVHYEWEDSRETRGQGRRPKWYEYRETVLLLLFLRLNLFVFL